MHSHLSNARSIIKPFGALHVVVPCFNPLRYVSRYQLFKDFVRHAEAAGATVWLAEIAFGGRPWQVTELNGLRHIQFRTHDEIWLKECVINATVARLPHDWQYVAWIDGDVMFSNPDWVQETIHQLQHYSVVQMFKTAVDLDPNGHPYKTFQGFPSSLLDEPLPDNCGYDKRGYFHPGYAWACTRQAWEATGGLLDINIVGGGDHQMVHAYYGNAAKAIPFASTVGYRNAVMAWQTHALLLKQNIGYVPGTLIHYWHGKKSRRGYFDRWKILADNKFDPVTDLRRDHYGLWKLAGNKPKLRDDLRRYFRSRQEDGIEE